MFRQAAAAILTNLFLAITAWGGEPESGSAARKVTLPVRAPATVTVTAGAEVAVPGYELVIRCLGVDEGEAATLEVRWAGGRSYPAPVRDAGDNGFRYDPESYRSVGGLLPLARVLYRTHRTCEGKRERKVHAAGYEALALKGYANYVCRSRFLEQCFADGSFDTFYDERCDYAPARFPVGQSRTGGDFAIKVQRVQKGAVSLEVSSSVPVRYGPVAPD